MRRLVAVGLSILVGFTMTGCAAGPSPSATPDATLTTGPGHGLTVAVSTPVLADIVSDSVGPGVEVWSVVPAYADPHTWEATPREMVKLTETDLYILMGAHLEAFEEGGAWRRAVDAAGIPVLRLADHLDLIVRDVVIDHGDHVHDLRDGDPHVWLDPAYVQQIARVVSEEVGALDPPNAASYAAAAVAYGTRLADLEQDLDAALGSIPPDRRRIVVAHDAFSYLERRFGIEVAGSVIASPGKEPAAGEIAALIDLVRSRSVAGIFYEPQLSADVARMVANETGVPVGTLMTDSFTDEVDDYLSLMRYNLASLVAVLGTEIASPLMN